MLQRLVASALGARLLVIGVAILVAGLGFWAFATLPIDAFPDIAPTQVKIILKAPGMTPEEVETRVITPIETEMLGIPDKVMLRSVAKYAVADITIDFKDGADIYWARQQTAERLAAVRDAMPALVEGGLAPVSTPLSDVLMFIIEGPLDLAARRSLLDWTIRPALRTLAGVADVNSLAGHAATFDVRPDPVALAAAGLTVADLRNAIMAGNRNDGAGRLAEGEEALIVRVVGAVQNVEDIEAQVVATRGGGVVRLGDVATVSIGSLTRYGAVSKDGKGEAVEGIVISMRGADASKVVAAVRDKLEALKPALPPGTSVRIFYDRADLIGKAASTVEEALLEATVLVFVLLFVFLGNIRAALIVAVTLPMAALITFILMRSIGLTANLMSLGGLAIAIGMLVDGAVVVIENAVDRQVALRDAAPLDANQVRAARDNARALEAAARGRAVAARANLAARFPLLPIPGGVPPIAAPALPAEGLAQWRDLVLARSHEIRAAELEAQRLRAVADRARLDRFADPSVGVRAFSERSGAETGIGMVTIVPLGGGYRRALGDQATAERSAAEARLAATRRDIEATANVDLAKATAGITAWQAAATSATNNRSVVARLRQGRRLGATDLASLLYAERQALDADRAELAARAAAERAILKLRIDAHLIWAKPE